MASLSSSSLSVGITSTFLHGNSDVFVWKAAASWFPTRRLVSKRCFLKKETIHSEGWMTTRFSFVSRLFRKLTSSVGNGLRNVGPDVLLCRLKLARSNAGARQRLNQPRRSVFCSLRRLYTARVFAEVVVVVLLTTSALASVFGSNQFPKEIQVFFFKH